MNRRRFLGWLAKGAALAIAAPAVDLAWSPAQREHIRQSAIEYLVAWHRRCPYGERGDILASGPLFDAYESEAGLLSRFTSDVPYFGCDAVYLKGRRMMRQAHWDGWRVATAGRG